MARFTYGSLRRPGDSTLTTEDVPTGPFNEEAHPLTGQYSPGEMFQTPGGIFTTPGPIPHKATPMTASFAAPEYNIPLDYYRPPDVGSEAWWRMVQEQGLPRDVIYQLLHAAGAAWSTVPPRPSQMSFTPQRHAPFGG